MHKEAAIAASTAFPPSLRTSTPISEHLLFSVATAPLRASMRYAGFLYCWGTRKRKKVVVPSKSDAEISQMNNLKDGGLGIRLPSLLLLPVLLLAPITAYRHFLAAFLIYIRPGDVSHTVKHVKYNVHFDRVRPPDHTRVFRH